MKNLKYISIVFILILSACESGPTNNSRLWNGQWTAPQSIGANSYLVEGYDTQDALNGARAQCQSMGKEFVMRQLTPHTSRTRATVTFSCN